mmetsp:Transcript_20167/g.57248  ORF Transcript_20167/g.57248 Transcript_20167/m.57248 type:complete len:166 (-) Transcript_20167:279-776(-)
MFRQMMATASGDDENDNGIGDHGDGDDDVHEPRFFMHTPSLDEQEELGRASLSSSSSPPAVEGASSSSSSSARSGGGLGVGMGMTRGNRTGDNADNDNDNDDDDDAGITAFGLHAWSCLWVRNGNLRLVVDAVGAIAVAVALLLVLVEVRVVLSCMVGLVMPTES